MTCYDIYIIFFPPDPTSLACGSNVCGSTIIMMSPPPAGFLPSNCKVSKATVCTEIPDPTPQPPTGKYTPPGEDPVDLEFEEKETDDGDPYYEAPLPDTEGEDYEFDIDIPLEEGEDPETIPLKFTHGGFRLSDELGTPYVYTMDSNYNLCRLSAETGGLLKTWNYGPEVIAVSNQGVVIFTDGGALYRIDGDDIVVINSDPGFFYSYCGFGLNNEICVQVAPTEGGEL